AALKERGTGEKLSIAGAARKFDVTLSTLRRRFYGLSKAPHAAHEDQQHLNEAQEDVLVKWLEHLGHTGHAISKKSIRPKVYALCGRFPNKKWITRFLSRHPELVLARPTTIDQKRAQAFN
ncbi:hypothetical protein BV25DRAFT_1767236, partial [Artomyces pyxidatus]